MVGDQPLLKWCHTLLCAIPCYEHFAFQHPGTNTLVRTPCLTPCFFFFRVVILIVAAVMSVKRTLIEAVWMCCKLACCTRYVDVNVDGCRVLEIVLHSFVLVRKLPPFVPPDSNMITIDVPTTSKN